MSVVERMVRRDWLYGTTVLLTLLLLVGVAAALEAVVSAVLRWSVPVRVDADWAGADRLPPGARLADSPTVDAMLTSPTWTQSALDALTKLPTYAVLITVLALLLRVIRDARRADPFTATTVRRLRIVGLLLIVAGSLADILEATAALLLAGTVEGGGVVGVFFFNGVWIIAGVGALAVAEVFNRGTAMRAELDTVI